MPHEYSAERLQRQVRNGEHLARLGGEESVWILPNATSAGAYGAAERARLAISAAPFPQVGTLTISAGVCQATDASDVNLIYHQADQALYAAEAQGRNRTIIHPPTLVTTTPPHAVVRPASRHVT